ncbi:MAG: hypothetical protein GY720_01750 [bacterium]|nr:hypothetical protein [bacterium]
MKRHQVDPISAGFGLLFAAIGLGFLFGNIEWESINVAAVWAIGLLVVGIAVLGSTALRLINGDD